MNRLASTLATLVRERIDHARDGAASEVRLIFHGPPLEILGETFEKLVAGIQPRESPVPVVLQIPFLEQGQQNPPVGASGRCDETHLLNLRNSPAQPTYVALVPPGQHSNKSVATTTDEFGMAASSNAGNVPFEEWWADEFLQGLVATGIAAAGIPHSARDDALSLVERAATAADEVDPERTQRSGAWRVVARLFSAKPADDGLSPGDRIALVCGVPPMGDGTVSAKEQSSTLGMIADALADGFGVGIERAQEGASDEEATHLGAFLAHLKDVCQRPTAFERATAAYYSPGSVLELPVAPAWWKGLTVEKWSELLTEDTVATGDIHLICTNGIVPLGKGMPVLVEGEVALEFEMVGLEGPGALVTIERTPGGPDGKEIGQINADRGSAFVDGSPPAHRTPMRYVASADRFKPSAIKIVSLASWVPGIVVACRLATKLAPPKKPARRGGDSADLESSLTLPGAGRYELLVFASPGVEIGDLAAGNPDDSVERGDAATMLSVRSIRDRQFQIEVEVDGNYQVDVYLSRTSGDGTVSQATCRVFLTIEEVRSKAAE